MLDVSPSEAALGAFSSVVLALSAENNIRGVFSDTLVVAVDGLEAIEIPVVLRVTGNVVVLMPDTLGLVMASAVDDGTRARLSFGTALQDGPLVRRTVRCFNRSPFDMRLAWSVYTPNTSSRVVDVSLEPDEEAGTVRVGLVPHLTPAPPDTPFRIEPAEMVIPGRGKAEFAATFATHGSGPQAAFVLASSELVDGTLHRRLNTGSSAGAAADASGEGALAGVPPATTAAAEESPLRVDLVATTLIPEVELDPPGEVHIRHSHGGVDGEAVRAERVVLRNGTPREVRFRLVVPPLFVVRSVAGEPVESNSTLEACDLVLGPRESIDLALAFDAAAIEAHRARAASVGAEGRLNRSDATAVAGMKGSAVAAAMARSVYDPDEDALAVDGVLVLAFDNGTRQEYRCRATVLYPYLAVDPADLDFGRVFVDRHRRAVLRLSNPSRADARWAVRCAEEVYDDGVVREYGTGDDGEAWVDFSPRSGLIPGRDGIAAPHSVQVTLTFSPRAEGAYEAFCEFETGSNGAVVDVRVVAVGTYEETEDLEGELARLA